MSLDKQGAQSSGLAGDSSELLPEVITGSLDVLLRPKQVLPDLASRMHCELLPWGQLSK